jgi:mRNA interferase RelE/StbE
MSYKLRFYELALDEWHKIDGNVLEPLKKKLAERLKSPRIPSATLSGMSNCYKIKMRTTGIGWCIAWMMTWDL